MAVPFYVPDEDDIQNSGSSQSVSTTPNNNNNNNQQNYNTMQSTSSSPGSSQLNTPSASSSSFSPSSSQQQSPNNFIYDNANQNNQNRLNGEHLIQVLYEALYRIGGSQPNLTMPPQSPSCIYNNVNNNQSGGPSSSNPGGHYGDIFFPRSNNQTPRTPYTPQNHGRNGNHFDYPRRNRLSSTGEENDFEDNCYDHSGELDSSSSDDFQINHMSTGERLPMFPGRVPPRRKKKEHPFAWPTVVTAVVIAVGCGILVTRN